MKWYILGLILLGTLAAVCAAILVGSLQARQGGGSRQAASSSPEIDIVVAQKDLPATQIISADDMGTRKILKTEAPQDYMTDPVQVVGKVLVVPVVKGQALTKTCFAKEGSGLQLAAALPEGMRAVGVQLTDETGLAGILYPGSLVDVLVTYRGPKPDDTVTKTLFQNIQVLGVKEQTIVNTEEGESKSTRSQVSKRYHVVTLLLDRFQAEQLQSAMKHGFIALALRNPMDKANKELVQREAASADKEKPVWEMTILRAREPEMKKFGQPEKIGG